MNKFRTLKFVLFLAFVATLIIAFAGYAGSRLWIEGDSEVEKLELNGLIDQRSYEDFVQLLHGDEVKRIELDRSRTFPVGGIEFLRARVMLKDGNSFWVESEPAKVIISKVKQEVERCGNPCKDVEVIVVPIAEKQKRE